jgi:broad specificity phosphatase PhoE
MTIRGRGPGLLPAASPTSMSGNRVAPILDQVVARFRKDDVVIVSHGGMMVAMWAYMTGRWDETQVPANCGIMLVEHRHGRFLEPQLIRNQQSQSDAGG